MSWKRTCLSLSVFVLLSSANAAGAFSNYVEGVELMKQKQYGRAIASFEQALRENPNDANSHYCLGTCYYQMHNVSAAKDAYMRAYKLSPGSVAGKNSLAAMQNLNAPAGARSAGTSQPAQRTTSSNQQYSSRTQTTSVSTGRSQGQSEDADLASLPNQTRIDFHRPNDGQQHIFVNAYLNNRPMEMMFDTGAEHCLFGFNHLAEAGIAPPTGKHTGISEGVGGGKAVWEMRANELKVGSIVRRNFPIIACQQLGGRPLLGQSFYGKFKYKVDYAPDGQTGNITLTKIGSSQGQTSVASRAVNKNNRYMVQFTKLGRDLLVPVEVNGRTISMIFDTGAHGVTFSMGHLKKLGISIPSDAEDGANWGTGGTMKTKVFAIDRIRMGPIEKNYHRVNVITEGEIQHPLMGQSFFGDWRYSIDNENNTITFER